MLDSRELSDLCAALKAEKEVLIASHISPDPDALGSCFALQRGLATIGIAGTVYLSEPIPERLQNLFGNAIYTLDAPSRKYPALIGLDTASKKRLGPEFPRLLDYAERVFNIDHHASNEMWGSVNFVRPDVPATAVLVLAVLESLRASIDAQTANMLFAGLSDDTGSFRFSNATETAFAAAARLQRLGAEPEKIANALYFSLPERTIRLRARAMSSLKFVAAGKIALVAVSESLLQEVGAKPEDTDGLVDIARSCEGVVGAVFLRELADGWKASLRSKSSTFDVNAVAAEFGGGGHVAAAGCRVPGPLAEAEQLIEQALLRHLPQ